MKKLFGYADAYIQQSDWKTLAMLKFCLASIGVLIGISLPKKGRKPAMITAGILFAVTYVPLMAKFFRIVFEKKCPEEQ